MQIPKPESIISTLAFRGIAASRYKLSCGCERNDGYLMQIGINPLLASNDKKWLVDTINKKITSGGGTCPYCNKTCGNIK